MIGFYSKEKEIGIKAVLQATKLAKKMQGKLETLDVVSKEDFSPVTITDFSVQALINMYLSETFPEDPIMGEEDTLLLRSPESSRIRKKILEQIKAFFPQINEEKILEAIDKGGCEGGKEGRFWVLDPIDGTRGFIHDEQYAIALALVEEGEVVLGFLSCPRLSMGKYKKGALFVATRGEGCYLVSNGADNWQQVFVNQTKNPREVIYCEPHTTSKTHSHSKAQEIAQILGADPCPFRLDSQCKYALVAKGDAHIYLRIPVSPRIEEKIWDHAAGVIVVEEAGGQVTDLEGKPLDFGLGKILKANFGVLATNRFLHPRVLEAIEKIKSE